VNIQDFGILAGNFNRAGTFATGDFNYDGVTNIQDFSILAGKFNTSLPAARPAATVPAATALSATAPRAARAASTTFGTKRVEGGLAVGLLGS
jgi:hypothetical protein